MKFFQKTKFLIPILLLLVLLIVGSVAGYAIAKYRSDVVMTDKITTRTQLVDSFTLTSTRRADGSTEVVNGDTAYLIPGVEVGMRLNIEGKSAIRSYLYIEITGGSADGMLTDDWTRLEGVTGKHGGAIYAYKTILDGAQEDLTIDILRKGLTMDDSADQSASPLSFCGYLLQITEEETRGTDQAKTTFVNIFPQG